MHEIGHNQIPELLDKKIDPAQSSCFLVHGQEMLVDQAVEQLLNKLLEGESRDLCCEKIEGVVENIPDLLEQMNTFSLLSGPKVVLFKEARLFEGRGNLQGLVDRIDEAWNKNEVHHAAKFLLSLCGRLEIDLDAARRGHQGDDALKELYGRLGTGGVMELVDYCNSNDWSPSLSADYVDTLRRAIEKGFPEHHHLIVTVYSKVPKNLKLYKTFGNHGVVIDCNVPLGERQADKKAQEAVMRQTLDKLLAGSGKRLSPGQFQTLCQLTGFDLRTFAQNVEKIIDYVGERTEITAQDIHAVLQRTKSDPVFELTNAVAERNIVQSLFYLNSLLYSKWHPLQIVSALVNQIRKLLVAKSFAVSPYGKSWSRAMSYSQFSQSVMPAVADFDNHSRERAAQWSAPSSDAGANRQKGRKSALDVVLAVNPKSPYPVYQTLLKSENYTLEELINAMAHLNQTDLRLKSTGQDGEVVLKKTIIEICRKS